ncbi:hypothetical protein [Limnoglobus roseus]|uniref:Helix-turn-helix domain-containing protein n=1 Tax=Limnoglobus roseus TaxID=2598579 RepID=A0A5C1AR93_9BACT|nr:hypothetical protein [Limnoglobus roseus]QEL20573.1 hypothetical protein PX52LOC_07678 [Limnoglobus roseus]
MANATTRRTADDHLILALACGATQEAAATKAGLGVTTVRRRLQDPDFVRRLRAVQADIVARTAAALTAAATESVRTLLDLQKPGTPPATRLGAARAVLELGLKVREVVELEARIAALEAQVDGDPRGGP